MSVESVACANHPFRITVLRCNRCNKPVCTKCIVRTPVGYRCKECVEEQQEVYATARWHDYMLSFAAAVAVTTGFGLTMGFFCCFIIPVAPLIGGFAVSASSWITGGRYSRFLPWAVIGGTITGGILLVLILIVINVLFALFNWEVSNFGILSQTDSMFVFLALIGIAVTYTIINAGTVYFHFRRSRRF